MKTRVQEIANFINWLQWDINSRNQKSYYALLAQLGSNLSSALMRAYPFTVNIITEDIEAVFEGDRADEEKYHQDLMEEERILHDELMWYNLARQNGWE